MKKYKITLAVFFLWMMSFGSLGNIFASADHDLTPYTGSVEFEKIKALAGNWEGTVTEPDGKVDKAGAKYQVTSGGSAVVETLFPGTPHEMVSVYYDKNGKLTMMHYCMLKSKPELELTQSSGNVMELALSSSVQGFDPSKDSHMHALKITLSDKDHLIQNWSHSEEGQIKGTNTINLSRV